MHERSRATSTERCEDQDTLLALKKKPVPGTNASPRLIRNRAGRPSQGSHFVSLCAAAFVLLVCAAASAAPPRHLHGVVLSLSPQAGTVIVRHDAFAGMPAMTMTFRVVPKARVRELQPGAIVDADVDVGTDPWTLRNVTSKSAEAVTAGPLTRRVTPLRIGDSVPDTAFVDQNGRPFRFAQLRGGDVVLAFVYTRCQDARMCPLISAKFHALQSAAGRRRVHLVEVTLDPAYDRPPVLARYAKAFEADPRRWTLVVGDANETLDFAARFGIATFPDPNAGIIHAENTVLIEPDGTIAQMITDTSWTPAEIIADIDAEHGRAANPFARIDPGVLRAVVFVAIMIAALVYLARRVYRAIVAGNA
jgi:protein SCO1/2